VRPRPVQFRELSGCAALAGNGGRAARWRRFLTGHRRCSWWPCAGSGEGVLQLTARTSRPVARLGARREVAATGAPEMQVNEHCWPLASAGPERPRAGSCDLADFGLSVVKSSTVGEALEGGRRPYTPKLSRRSAQQHGDRDRKGGGGFCHRWGLGDGRAGPGMFHTISTLAARCSGGALTVNDQTLCPEGSAHGQRTLGDLLRRSIRVRKVVPGLGETR